MLSRTCCQGYLHADSLTSDVKNHHGSNATLLLHATLFPLKSTPLDGTRSFHNYLYTLYKKESDGSRSPGHRICLSNRQDSSSRNSWVEGRIYRNAVGFIRQIREGYGIKHEEAETRLRGKLEPDRSHVERPKPATSITLLVLQNTGKDVKWKKPFFL